MSSDEHHGEGPAGRSLNRSALDEATVERLPTTIYAPMGPSGAGCDPDLPGSAPKHSELDAISCGEAWATAPAAPGRAVKRHSRRPPRYRLHDSPGARA